MGLTNHIKRNKKKYGLLWIISIILTLYFNQPVYRPYATISGCTSITSSGEYYLDSDIINSTSMYCINITANNVVLDCQNHKVDGDDSAIYGIYVNRASRQNTNITIRNCIVTDWAAAGIFFQNASNNTVQNTTAKSNSRGIRFWYSESNMVRDVRSNENYIGIEIRKVNFSSFENITLKDNSNDGVGGGDYCNNNTFRNINAIGNSYYGFVFTHSSHNKFKNIISSNNKRGFELYDCSDFVLDNVTASGNSERGIYLSSSGSNTIANSTIQNNAQYGIYISSANSNKIYNNLFNNTVNFYISGTGTNYWNTSRQTGSRIYSLGTEIGGNYWTNSTGNGYSDICNDTDRDGFCDDPYTLASNNVDYLPLSDEYQSSSVELWNGSEYVSLPAYMKFICSYIESDCEPYYQNSTQAVLKASLISERIKNLKLKLPHDKSIIFDGEDDYIKIPDSGNLVFSDELTITAWIKPYLCKDIDDKAGNIIGRMNNEFRFRLNTDCQFWFLIANQSNSEYHTFPTKANLSEWQHVAITFDNGLTKLYKNGEYVENFTFNITSIKNSATPVYIGSYNETAGFFNGEMDDIRLYKRVLTQYEIKNIYLNGTISFYKLRLALPFYGDVINGTAIDQSGWNNNGNITGHALEFDGENDYVEVPDDSSLDITDAITISAWIYLPNVVGDKDILQKADDVYEPYRFYTHNDRLIFQLSQNSTVREFACTSYGVLSTGWQHIAVTYDKTEVKFYVNSVEKPNVGDTPTYSLRTTIGDLYIGIRKAGWSNPFNGTIDDVRIYNRSLNAEEIAKLYNHTYYNETGLVLHLKFDEGSGNTAYDSSDQENNGTVNGATWVFEDRRFNNSIFSTPPSGYTLFCNEVNTALEFDGVDDYVNIPSVTLNKDSATMSFWFKASADFSSGYANRALLVGENKYQRAIYLRDIDGVGNYKIDGETDTNGEFFANTGEIINRSVWNNVVVTFSNGVATTYLNGVSADTRNINDNLTFQYIGGAEDVWLNGTIDEIRIYNRALTSQEISSLYNNTYANSTGLVLYLKFNELEGNTAIDSSTYGNNGTIYGAEYTTSTPFDEIEYATKLNSTYTNITKIYPSETLYVRCYMNVTRPNYLWPVKIYGKVE